MQSLSPAFGREEGIWYTAMLVYALGLWRVASYYARTLPPFPSIAFSIDDGLLTTSLRVRNVHATGESAVECVEAGPRLARRISGVGALQREIKT